jgi:hypothetical protein
MPMNGKRQPYPSTLQGRNMNDEESVCLQRIAQLQDYPVDRERARQLRAELEAFRGLLRQEVPALAFDDQPADFRAVQLGKISRV